MNWYKHHLGDYAKATAHLSILEHGVYLLMLHHHYATEAPLPTEPAVICRIIRASSKTELAAVVAILQRFWRQTEEGWVNDRALEEFAAADELRRVNRKKGKLGGRPKKAGGFLPANPPANPRLSSGLAGQKPTQTPDTRHQEKGDNPPYPPAASPPVIELPSELPATTWKAFRDHRQRLRAPLTHHAETLLLAKLSRLAGDGHDPAAVVEQSIERGWKGLFPIADPPDNHHAPSRPSAADRHRDSVAIADDYAERALAAELAGSILRTDARPVSAGVDLTVVHGGRVRTSTR